MLPKAGVALKFMLSMGVILVAAAVVTPATAQSGNVGCQYSPENPTAILALVGSAGGALVALRSRLRRK